MHNYAQTCEGFACAGFDPYYALLNLGVRVKLSAGGAYGVQPTPLGWSRIYVHVGADFSPDSWFKALQMGRSFVTTGPMMLLKVNGLEPGEEQRGGDFPLRAQVELTVLSVDPVERAEIVLNGMSHSISLMRNNSNRFSFNGMTTLKWIAARYIAPHGETANIAHTSPIFFWNQNRPISISAGEAQYVLDRIDNLICEAKAGPG